MKQALHIFCKDVRYLWIEICLLIALAIVFTWVQIHLRQGWWAESLFEFAAVYTIAKLIHAEAIPGDRQFWLTRPYRPMSLLSAKLLFIFTFICLPIACIQIALVAAGGFPLGPSVPALLCSQALFFFVAALPVAALAAVTSAVLPFILSALFLTFLAFAGPTAAGQWMHSRAPVPPDVNWIRVLVFQLLLVLAAGMVLLWQYRERKTDFSRGFAIAALNVAGLVYLIMPAAVLLTAQSWLSKKPMLAEPVTVAVGPPIPKGLALSGGMMRIPVTINATGIPEANEARADAIGVTFEWPGYKWKPTSGMGLNRRSQGMTQTVFEALVPMDPKLFKERRDAPVTIRGTIYLTLFGEDEARTIPLTDGFHNVQDGLRCGKTEFIARTDAVGCFALFGWPARLVYSRDGVNEADFSNSLISYSPMPSGMSLDATDFRLGDATHEDHATIITKKPLVHFHRDFEMRNVRLAEFENRPPGYMRR